jgi:protein-tyrosine phosphatase
MASFANSSHDNEGIPKPIGNFANLIRVGNMVGPGETNWVMMGQLLVGGHPGLVSQSNLVRNLEGILKEDINLFVCLQSEFSTNQDVHINSAKTAGSNLIRKRNAYGLRYMSSCGPYLSDAKLVAGRLLKNQNTINFMHYPIPEANDAVATDSEATAVTARVLSAIMAGDRVYLHCSDGNGRAGTIASLLLGIVHGLSSSEAMTLVDMYRTHRRGIQGLSLETHQQKAQVHRLLSNLEWRKMMCATNPCSAAESNMNRRTVEKVLEEIKGGLMRRGIHAFIKLRRLLERRDYENTGNVNLYDLTEALRTLGLGVRDCDIISIVKRYQHEDLEGAVNYNHLLSAIRGEMSNERLKVVRKAFDKIRVGSQSYGSSYDSYSQQQNTLASTPDQVTLLQMKKHYRAKNVQEVKNGQKSEAEAVSDFLDTFFNAGVTDRQIVVYDDFVSFLVFFCPGI